MEEDHTCIAVIWLIMDRFRFASGRCAGVALHETHKAAFNA